MLSNNLGEHNGYGFYLDTLRPGQSKLMHTHSYKPKPAEVTPRNNPAHDVRFEYDSTTKKIVSYALESQCMQVLIAKDKPDFALLDCSDRPHQKIVYTEADKTIKLDADQNYCVAVDSTIIEAGPWVKRALQLVECSEIEASQKQWLVVSN